MVSPTASLDPENVTIEVGLRLMGHKAAKRAKQGQDGDGEAASHAGLEVVIELDKDLSELCIQAQQEANWLTSEMLHLEGPTHHD